MKLRKIFVTICCAFVAMFSACFSGCSPFGDDGLYVYTIDPQTEVIYYQGDEIDISNYILNLTNTQTGEVEEVALNNNYIVTMPDMSSAGEKEIKISYNGNTYSFKINVKTLQEKYSHVIDKLNSFIQSYKDQNKVGSLSVTFNADLATKYFGEEGTIDYSYVLTELNDKSSQDKLLSFLYSTVVNNLVETAPDYSSITNNGVYTFDYNLVNALKAMCEDLQAFDYYNYIVNDLIFTETKLHYVSQLADVLSGFLSSETITYRKVELLVNAYFTKVLNKQPFDFDTFIDEYYNIIKQSNEISQEIKDYAEIIYNQTQTPSEHFFSELYKNIMTYNYKVCDDEGIEIQTQQAQEFLTNLINARTNYFRAYEDMIVSIVNGSFDIETSLQNLKETLEVLSNLEDERYQANYEIWSDLIYDLDTYNAVGVFSNIYKYVFLYKEYQTVNELLNLIYELPQEDNEYISNFIYNILEGKEVDYKQFVFDFCEIVGIYDETQIETYKNFYEQNGYATVFSDYLKTLLDGEGLENIKQAVIDFVVYLEKAPVDGIDKEQVNSMLEDALIKAYEDGVMDPTFFMIYDLAKNVYQGKIIEYIENNMLVEMLVSVLNSEVNLNLSEEDCQLLTDHIYSLIKNEEVDFDQLIIDCCRVFGICSEEEAQKYINQFNTNGYVTIFSDYLEPLTFPSEEIKNTYIDLIKYVEKIPVDGYDNSLFFEKVNAIFDALLEQATLAEDKLLLNILTIATDLTIDIDAKLKQFVSDYQFDIEDGLVTLVCEVLGFEQTSVAHQEVKSLIQYVIYNYINAEVDIDYVVNELNSIVDLYCDKNTANNVKSIETLLLILAGQVEEIDYNELFAFIELPPAIESIDYNKLIAKLTEKETFENIFKLNNIKVEYILDENQNIIGQNLMLVLDVDFDVMISGINGSLALNVEIVF